MSTRGPLGGGDHGDTGGTATGDQVAQQGDELFLLVLVADGGRVEGDLIDDDGDDRQPVGGGDLAPVLGA